MKVSAGNYHNIVYKITCCLTTASIEEVQIVFGITFDDNDQRLVATVHHSLDENIKRPFSQDQQ